MGELTAMIRKTTALAALVFALGSAAASSAAEFSADDIEATARVAFAEAGNDPVDVAAVIDVILNRLESGRFGSTAQAVVNAPRQFEVVMRATGDWRNLPPLTEKQRITFATIWALKSTGQLGSVVGNATYFQNPAVVAERAGQGRVKPGLVHFGGMPQVGATPNGHVFYAPAGARSASAPAPTSAAPATKMAARRKPLRSMVVEDSSIPGEGEAQRSETVLMRQETTFVMPEIDR